MLLDHVTEYELLTDPPELALTLLRSVGQISRDLHRYRDEPAGPQTPTPGAQCLGVSAADLAVYPHAGAWRNAEPRLRPARPISFPPFALGGFFIFSSAERTNSPREDPICPGPGL